MKFRVVRGRGDGEEEKEGAYVLGRRIGGVCKRGRDGGATMREKSL